MATSAAERVASRSELFDLIMAQYKPISKFHHDPDHRQERKGQMLWGQCSDAETLTRVALVCRSWFWRVMPFLWHDVSSNDLLAYITGGRPPQHEGDYREAMDRLGWFRQGAGQYIKTFYFQANQQQLLQHILPQRGVTLGFNNITDIHIELSHPEALESAIAVLDTDTLDSLHVTVLPFDEHPHEWALQLPRWFTMAFDALARCPSYFGLVVADPALWAALAPGVVWRLGRMQVVKRLDCHVNMLTADVLEALRPMSREGVLQAICAVGACTRPLLVPDCDGTDVDMDGADAPGVASEAFSVYWERFTDWSWLRQLSLCGTLAQAQELLTRIYYPKYLRHLDLALLNIPTPATFRKFLHFVAHHCSEIQVLKITFPAATLDAPLTLGWTDLETLGACKALEELELTNVGIELRSSDTDKMTATWPRPRALKLVPHPARLVFCSLHYLAEPRPAAAEDPLAPVPMTPQRVAVASSEWCDRPVVFADADWPPEPEVPAYCDGPYM